MSKRLSLFDTLLQPWPPCTGSWTVVDYLRYSPFPTSYRPLCTRWESLGRPSLRTASASNLEEMTTKEETVSVEAPATQHARSIEDFVLFFHNYCSFHAELEAFSYSKHYGHYDQESTYESHKLTLFAALESDRSACQKLGQHDCFKTRLWGPAYMLSSRDLWQLLGSHHFVPPQTGIATSTLAVPARYKAYPQRDAHFMPSHDPIGSTIYTNSFQHFPSSALLTRSTSDVNVHERQDHESPIYSSASSTSFPIQRSNGSDIGEMAALYGHFDQASSGRNQTRSNSTPTTSEDKRRKEQNAEKSKRHRDRMVTQRGLLLDLVNAYTSAIDDPTYRPTSTFGLGIYAIITEGRERDDASRDLTISESRIQRGTRERRNIKAIQRADELRHFEQINRICDLLLAQEVNPATVVDLFIPSDHLKHRGGDFRLFLSILTGFYNSWDILLEAEARLRHSITTDVQVKQPISGLLDRLRSILAGQFY